MDMCFRVMCLVELVILGIGVIVVTWFIVSIVRKYCVSENWFSYIKSRSLITLVIGHIKTYLKYTRGLLNDYRVHAYRFSFPEISVWPCHVVLLICHKTVIDISLAFSFREPY